MKWFSSFETGSNSMLDFFYVFAGCAFLLVCWAFAKACDKL